MTTKDSLHAKNSSFKQLNMICLLNRNFEREEYTCWEQNTVEQRVFPRWQPHNRCRTGKNLRFFYLTHWKIFSTCPLSLVQSYCSREKLQTYLERGLWAQERETASVARLGPALFQVLATCATPEAVKRGADSFH